MKILKIPVFKRKHDKNKEKKPLPMRSRICTAICLFCLLVLTGTGLFQHYMQGKLVEQNEAQRWAEGKNYAQITGFFAPDASITREKIKEFEYNINEGLKTASVESESTNPDARLFADAYSSFGKIELRNGQKSKNTNACGIGGDFFMFHPIPLAGGGYFSGKELMHDKVIVDEEVAWELFGSNDIVGQTVTIGGKPHIIAGVAKREKGRLLKAAGLTQSYVYVSFETLSEYGTILSSGITGGTSSVARTGASPGGSFSDTGWAAGVSGEMPKSGISCYEIVMPDIVDHFARDLFRQKLNMSEDKLIVVDNTHRFTVPSLWRVMKAFGTRSMQVHSVIYPYWENEARGWEDIFAHLLFWKMICASVLIVMIAVWTVQAYRHRKWTVGELVRRAADRKYEWESRRRYRGINTFGEDLSEETDDFLEEERENVEESDREPDMEVTEDSYIEWK